jgi:hypothetical protein
MPGGLMNLVSYGDENVILNSNPKKTFFRVTYAKHTNFGLQKFRIDFEKERPLSFINETEIDFKIPRNADLLYDTFICITMPNIYSTLYYDGTDYDSYEFKWIKNLGVSMIKDIHITSNGITLAKYSGEYLHCLSHRDLNADKKNVFNQMTGNTKEMYDPANSEGLSDNYPNSYWLANNTNPEPSIRQRKLYIPITCWFSENSKLALPLVALQYAEIKIKITFRPVKELYTIIDVEDSDKPRISPNPNNTLHQIRRFIRKPLETDLSSNPVINSSDNWVTDIHLISTYVFLDKKERENIASKGQSFLIKQVIEHEFLKQTGTKKIELPTSHCISNYMFRFRRSDVKDRNEWTNFTNWQFEGVRPQTLLNAYSHKITGGTGSYPKNLKNILINFAVLINGEYRENMFDNGIFLYCEKYSRTNGSFKDGLYHYSFALNTLLKEYQPSGSMNLTKYGKITFEYNTIETPINSNSKTTFICGITGDLIGIRKNAQDLNEYNFDFKVFEEKYNVITIQNGMASLMLQN